MVVAGCLMLTGCASVPKADIELDHHAKSFQSYGKLSNIYVYSENGSAGGAVTWDIRLDGQSLGAIKNGDFMLLVVPSGRHKISSLGDFGAKSMGETSAEVVAMPGEKYFFMQAFQNNLVRRGNDFHQVDDATGRNGVLNTNLVLTKQSLQDDVRAKFAPPEKISAPRPISGNKGKYMSPFTAAGTVAPWAQARTGGKDNGPNIAANAGGAIGRQLANKALDFVPFGLGGLIGQQLGESAGRAATSKNIEPELPSDEAIRAGSDISFNSLDSLALYMYAKHSTHADYFRVLTQTQRVYPDLGKAYFPALEKASKPYVKKRRS